MERALLWLVDKKWMADGASLYAGCCAGFGGGWDLGGGAGPFRFGVCYAASSSNSNLGTHQMFDPSFLMFRNDVTAPAPGNRTGPGL